MNIKATYVIAGVAVAAAALWVAKRQVGNVASDVADAVSDAAWAITPWNNENIIYGGVNKAGAAVTGNNDFSLGGAIYDGTHKKDGSFDWSYLQTVTPAGAIGYSLKRLFGIGQ